MEQGKQRPLTLASPPLGGRGSTFAGPVWSSSFSLFAYDTILSAMNIRNATLADIPVVTDYNVRLAKETEHLDLKLDTVTAGVSALVNDISKGIYFLAEVNGAVIGQLC